MSNAMRLGKRSLAGVAAGALALGMLSIASAPAASAKPSIKPKATLSQTAATVAPVRFSTGVNVLYSPIMFQAKSNVANDDTIVMTLVDSPSTAAGLYIKKAGGFAALGGSDDSLTYANASDLSTTAQTITGSSVFVNALSDDSTLYTYIAASAAGLYAGTITILDKTLAPSATPKQTVTFSVTTAGAPASIVLAPTAITLAASTSDTEAFSVVVRDSDGKPTQLAAIAGPTYTQTITVAKGANPTGGDDTTANFTSPTIGSLTAADFDDTTVTTLGTTEGAVVGVNTATAGTRNLTFTPAGVAMSGVAAVSLPITVIGEAANTPSSLTLTSPTTQKIDDTSTDDTKGYTVNANLINTAQVSGSGATASAPYNATISWTGLAAGVKVGGASFTSGSSLVVTSTATGTSTIGLSWTAGQTGQIIVRTGSGTTAKPARWVIIDVKAPVNDSSTSPEGAIIIKTGASQAFAVELVDNFGNPQANWSIVPTSTSNASPAVTASGTQVLTDASGKATVTAPPPSATFAGAATITFTVRNAGGSVVSSGVGSLATVPATYSATGDVTSISVAQAQSTPTTITNTTTAITKYPSVLVPFGGSTSAAQAGSFTPATSTAAAVDATAGTAAMFQPTASPANAVTVTVPEGLKVSDTAVNLWSGGKTTLTVASGTAVYVFGTKTGTHDVTFTSGTITTTAKIRVATPANAAYNIALEPAAKTVRAGTIDTVTLKVTDVFGNAVDTNDDSGAVTVSAAGQVLLSGYNTSISKVTTGADGTATVTLIAGADAGAGTITAVPNATTDAPAWKAGYTKPTGAAAPVVSAVSSITVETAPTAKTIVIVGERTTVNGAAGIAVDGLTTGFADGDKVKPFVRFPGGSYSEGTARPVITDSEFYWERKTGKKTYVYFTNEAGDVPSNRIIIPAK